MSHEPPPSPVARDSGVWPIDLRTQDASGLAAIAFPRPRLSWRLSASRDGVTQCAYEIEIASDDGFTKDLRTSGRVEKGSPVDAPWPVDALASREVAWARVRVWTEAGLTGWSEPLRIEGSLFEHADWFARPISPDFNVGLAEPAPVPLLRRRFDLREDIVCARLYVTVMGVHQTSLNGVLVSPDLLEPGWTSYHGRQLYASYDVTGLVQGGGNVIASAVGDGWWRGKLTWLNRRSVYGDTTALLAQLEVEYADGSRDLVCTDEHWRGSTGPITFADIYDGCACDLTLGKKGWRQVGYDDSAWSAVVTLPLPAHLEQRSAPAVRVVQRFKVKPQHQGRGRLRIDCGQNLTGYLRLSGTAEEGASIEVRHAEVLEPGGRLHTAALRGAKATDRYRFAEGAFDVSPHFTYHGFRYADVVCTAGVCVESVEVCVVSSDLQEIGRFACSDERINQLESNIRWSQRGNFVSLPTDCPQRDERMGWTGDIQVFAPTACTNFDCRAFLASWLRDLALEQAPDGQVTSTVPNVIQGHPYEFGGVGWADAAVLVPWALHEAYGNTEVLEAQFGSMCRWVDWAASRLNAQGVWRGDFHLGDWLDPGAPPDRPEEATTDRDFIASAYLSYSAGKLAAAARVLGRTGQAGTYQRLSDEVAAAAWREWRQQAVLTQTGCAIAICFGIAPPAEIEAVGRRLSELVGKSDGRIATGFLGTPLVLPALSRSGHTAAAYRLLLNQESPGWLNQVAHGATTMWERWDAITSDGSIHAGEMAADDADSMMSFNHYAYGSVGEWLYRNVAGIAPDERAPGYRRIVFRPEPGGGLTWAEASIETPLGKAAIRWELNGGALAISITVPPAAEARLVSPPGWSVAEGACLEFGSGSHGIALRRAP